MTTLYHVSLNTRHVSNEPLQQMTPDIRASLNQLIHDGKGKLPHPFSAFNVVITQVPGAAVFTLYRGKESAVTCGVAWREENAGTVWSTVEKLYLDLSDKLANFMPIGEPPEQPETLPWCATIMLPGMALCSLEDIGWMGDFERCLAAQLIRRGRGQA